VLHVCTLMLHTFKCLHIQSLYADVAYIQVFTHTRVTQAVQIRIQIHNMCCMFARWCCIHVNTLETKRRCCCTTWALKKKKGKASGNDAAEPQLSGGCYTQDRRLALPAVFAGFFSHPLQSSIPLCPWAKSVLLHSPKGQRRGGGMKKENIET
jgi:hypothetical protein